MTSNASPPPAKRDARRQARRDAIIAAARVSFLENGYAGTSMSGLLDIVGGSKATLWNHFRSKEELFAAVMEDVAARFRPDMDDALALGGGIEECLLEFCQGLIRTLVSPEGVATARLIAAESGRFPEIGKIFYDRAAGVTESRLAAFLGGFVSDGTLRAEDPTAMAQMLISLCKGPQTQLLWGLDRPRDTIDIEAARLVSWFMHAFARSHRPDRRCL